MLHCLLICTQCQIAVARTAIKHHLLDVHGIKNQIISKEVKEILEEHHIADVLPTLVPPVLQVEGLPMFKTCIQCGACPLILGTPGSVEKHYREKHAGTKPPANLIVIAAQKLDNSPSHKSYFEVIPSELVISTTMDESFAHDVRSECDEAYNNLSITSVDPRTISPWLRSTNWHLHIGAYQHQDLQALVANPGTSEDNLTGLRRGTMAFLQAATRLIPLTPPLILMKLNSPYPAKESVVLQFCKN